MERRDLQATQVFLHADDLGMNCSVTDGILAGFTQGLLTSTSVLANAPAFEYSISRWRWLEGERAAHRLASIVQRQRLHDRGDVPFDLGVHLNLTQGRPLTVDFPEDLLDAEGCFPGIWQIFRRLLLGAGRWRNAIQIELAAQIARVVECGLKPTHLNSHQYVELVPGVTELIPELAERFQIPVVRVALERQLTNALHGTPRPFSNWSLGLVKYAFARQFRRRIAKHKPIHPVAFCGTAHAGHVSLDVLRRFVAGNSGCRNFEIGLHPGFPATEIELKERADGWADPLEKLRPAELAMLQSNDTVELFASAGLHLSRLASLSRPTP